MLHTHANLLTEEQVQYCRRALAQARWEDGRITAGHIAQKAKSNLQLAAADPLANELGNLVLDALARHPQFMASALPLKVFPPRFNCYQDGGHYGDHVDNAVFSVPGTPHRIRSDLSATLFLSAPDEYDGGELIIEDTYGSHSVKLPAGHLVLYPSTSLHRVTPVTRGARLASFFWIQSLVRDDGQRHTLLELDLAIQDLTRRNPSDPALPRLTAVYHNLVRQWSET
ncbi:MAG: Fe2+-dependent dioxygenase [Porticoccaceae bacterium]